MRHRSLGVALHDRPPRAGHGGWGSASWGSAGDGVDHRGSPAALACNRVTALLGVGAVEAVIADLTVAPEFIYPQQSRPVNRLLGRDGWRPPTGTSEASASCFGCQITPVYWPGGGFAGFSTLQTSIRRPKTVDWPPVGGQTADKFPVPADGALFHAAMVSAAAGSATGTIIITASAGASRPG
jgi:hypothetical protein